MTNYKHEAKQAAHDKMKRMGLNKEHSGKNHFDDVHPYDGVPQLSTTIPSGAAPVGKQRFKRGGKVAHLEGNKAKQNLGKASRSKAPIPYESDEELKSGGVAAFDPMLRKKRAAAMAMRKKRMGLPYGAPMNAGASMSSGSSAMPTGNIMPHKKGGTVSAHPDEAQDRKLIRKEVKASALKGRAHKNDGGGLRSERTQYEKARRNSVDEGMNYRSDSTHNDEALRKAVRGYENTAKETGYSNLKTGGRAHRATGGRTKSAQGKSTINIIVSPESQKGASQMPMGGPPAIPPQLLAAMAGGAGGPPPGVMPPGPPPGMMPPGAGMAGAGGGLGAGPAMNVGRPGMTAPTPPMRKSGGRVGGEAPQAATPTYQEHDYGSGSGLGRLEKRKWPLAK